MNKRRHSLWHAVNKSTRDCGERGCYLGIREGEGRWKNCHFSDVHRASDQKNPELYYYSTSISDLIRAFSIYNILPVSIFFLKFESKNVMIILSRQVRTNTKNCLKLFFIKCDQTVKLFFVKCDQTAKLLNFFIKCDQTVQQ